MSLLSGHFMIFCHGLNTSFNNSSFIYIRLLVTVLFVDKIHPNPLADCFAFQMIDTIYLDDYFMEWDNMVTEYRFLRLAILI